MKKSTGEVFDTIDRLTGGPIKGHYYVWQQEKFCTRCGKPNENYEAWLKMDIKAYEERVRMTARLDKEINTPPLNTEKTKNK